MPGDPKECRKHALRCAELAHSARTQQLKQTMIELSRNWMKLAAELERSQALLDSEAVEPKKSA
jgi:hypothetical protein